MRRKITVLLACALACLWGWRVWSLNRAFPNPAVHAAGMGEPLEIDGFAVTMTGWEWKDGPSVADILPESELQTDRYYGTELSLENAKMAFVTLSVERVAEGTGVFDLTDVSFESGAWHNQWGLEEFVALNEGKLMGARLAHGEYETFVIPLLFRKELLSRRMWDTLETREYRAVLSVWPEKLYLHT